MLAVSFLIQLDSGILFHCCIQETCGAVILVWVPKKSPSPPKKNEQYSTQKFLFYQTDNKVISFVGNLSKAGHLKGLPLSQVKHG